MRAEDHFHFFYVLSYVYNDKALHYKGQAKSRTHFRERLKERCYAWGIRPTDPRLFISCIEFEIPKCAFPDSVEQGLIDEVNMVAKSVSDFLENTNKIKACKYKSDSLIPMDQIISNKGDQKGKSLLEYWRDELKSSGSTLFHAKSEAPISCEPSAMPYFNIDHPGLYEYENH